MADTLRIKRRAVGGAAGAPALLAAAEIAFNEQDNTLYYGKGDNGSGIATTVIPIAGAAYLPLTGGTLTGPLGVQGDITATGYATKAGTAGAAQGNYSNIENRSGTPHLWVDTTDYGVFTFGGPYAPLASPTFTGTPNAPAWYVNGRNVTPGQIGASNSWPNTAPASGPSGMQGLAYTFTPQSSARVLAVITGAISIGTANAGATVFLMRGTGTPPAHGAAQTGTTVLAVQAGAALGAGVQVPCPLIAVIGALTIGTAYWFDVYLSMTAGNGTYFNGGYSFLEV
jgi:hypothetical protein